MASFEMSIPHHLSQEEALKRIKNLLTDTKNEHGDKVTDLKENWNDNVGEFSFAIMGFAISGKLTVLPNAIDIEAELPFAASLFKGKIKELINAKASQLLS